MEGKSNKILSGVDMWQGRTLPLDHVGPNRWRGEGEKKEKRERRESSSNFSLRSMEIGGSVFIRPRTKDHLLNKGYLWVPKTRDFVEDSSEEFGKSRVSSLGSVHETS